MREPQIPSALGKSTVVFENGDTNDIIKVMDMGEADFKRYGKDFCIWANHNFEATEQSLYKLWKMVREEITYKIDPEGKQLIKAPPALFKIGQGDCKSKTLFINAVLRCLEIPYVTRYVSYTMSTTVTHVYTVANLNGKKIIIDSVYQHFNKQAPHKYKLDKPMAKISFIQGVPTGKEAESVDSTALCANYNMSAKQVAYLEGKAKTNKKIEEIRQKQEYVPKFEPVAFNELTDGQASLKLMERELEIIKVMKPELAKHCEKGLNLVHNALKGNYCLTGDIDPSLYRYARQIQTAQLRTRPGNSFGISQQRIEYLSKMAAGRCSPKPIGIGSQTFPRRECLNSLWLEQVVGANSGYYSPVTGNNHGFCTGTSIYALISSNPQGAFLRGNGQMAMTSNDISAFRNRLYFRYGANTPYRVSFNDYGRLAMQTLNHLNSNNIVHQPEPDGSFWINTQADFELMLEQLNQNSGVKSNWLNGSFATDTAGTLGTGMFYSFADQIQASISGFVPENNLPTQVQIKKSLQVGYLNSCVNFSGASYQNVQQLARQGYLFDSGGDQPEDTLSKLYSLTNKTAVSGHYVGEPMSAIMIMVVTIIGAALQALPGIITAINNGAVNAESIDPNLKASSQFAPPSLNQSPNASDWPVIDPTGGNGDNSKGGSSLLLPAIGLGLGALLLKSKQDD